MVQLTSTLLLLGFSGLTISQDLLSSLTNYPQTTTFQALLKANATSASSFVPASNSSKQYTIFVPSNSAFEKYASRHAGATLASLPQNDVLSLFRYHVTLGLVSAQNFSQPRGITVPTLLDGETYNNRSAGNALLARYGEEAKGQVLYISATKLSQLKFRVRQTSSVADLRSGLGLVTQVEAVDGKWDGGNFQIVDE